MKAWWRREFGEPLRGVVRALAGSWWWSRLQLRPVAIVAWGGRPDVDVWVGSRQDALLARERDARARVERAMVRFQLTFTDAFSASMRDAQRQLAAFGAALRARPR